MRPAFRPPSPSPRTSIHQQRRGSARAMHAAPAASARAESAAAAAAGVRDPLAPRLPPVRPQRASPAPAGPAQPARCQRRRRRSRRRSPAPPPTGPAGRERWGEGRGGGPLLTHILSGSPALGLARAVHPGTWSPIVSENAREAPHPGLHFPKGSARALPQGIVGFVVRIGLLAVVLVVGEGGRLPGREEISIPRKPATEIEAVKSAVTATRHAAVMHLQGGR